MKLDSSRSLPLLDKMDFARHIPNFPPMPNGLRWIIFIVRALPAATQALLALAIATNPATASAPLLKWTAASYGMTSDFWALWLVIFGLASGAWSFSGRWRYGLLLRVVGLIVFTFPLLLFVGLTAWYTLVVDPTRSRTAVVLYISLYVSILSMYALSAALAVWFEQIRLALRKASNGTTWT